MTHVEVLGWQTAGNRFPGDRDNSALAISAQTPSISGERRESSPQFRSLNQSIGGEGIGFVERWNSSTERRRSCTPTVDMSAKIDKTGSLHLRFRPHSANLTITLGNLQCLQHLKYQLSRTGIRRSSRSLSPSDRTSGACFCSRGQADHQF